MSDVIPATPTPERRCLLHPIRCLCDGTVLDLRAYIARWRPIEETR